MTDWLALLARGLRYVGTASSDSHMIAYRQAGYPRTYVYTPGAGDVAPEPDVVLRALRAGHAFGTSGPMIFARVGDKIPGDTVHTALPEVQLSVQIVAAPWIPVDRVDVYRDGALFTTLPVPVSTEPIRMDQTVTVPLALQRGFVLVVARSDQTMEAVLPSVNARPFAFTNPLWLVRTRQSRGARSGRNDSADVAHRVQ